MNKYPLISLNVSVIMPTYNEAGHIAELISDVINHIANFTAGKLQIIVVDDNSPDGTWEIASAVKSSDAEIQVIRRMAAHGLTASIKEGIAASKHDVVIWLDCDFTHPPECIPQLLFMIDRGYHVAVNSRYVVGGGEDRRGKGGTLQLFLSQALNWGVRFLLYPAFSDYTSGFVAAKKEVLEDIELRGEYGEYFLDFVFRVLKKKKYRICELPYFAVPRRSGESKTGSNIFDYIRRGRKYLWMVFKLRFEAFTGII